MYIAVYLYLAKLIINNIYLYNYYTYNIDSVNREVYKKAPSLINYNIRHKIYNIQK